MSSFGGSAIRGTIDADSSFFKKIKAQIELAYTRRIVALLTHLHRTVSVNTAVWEGETLSNWKWAANAPDLSHRDPIANGPTGATNTMSLGEEPRRGPNQEAFNANFQRMIRTVSGKVPSQIYLTNTGEVAVLMEFGGAPGGRGQNVRTSGMLRLAVREAILFRANLKNLTSVGPLYTK